eukprot:1161150-Pelagomonas_calceolata.AAC.2
MAIRERYSEGSTNTVIATPGCLLYHCQRSIQTQAHMPASISQGCACLRACMEHTSTHARNLCFNTSTLMFYTQRRKTIRLERLAHIVVDEADKLLDLGFEPELRSMDAEQEGKTPQSVLKLTGKRKQRRWVGS